MTPSSPLFWNLIAKRYAKNPVPDEAVYQRKLAEVRAALTPQSRVFEFGCGTGTTALHHAPHAAQIDAIDYSRNMIAIAQGKADAQGAANVNFQVAALEDWPEAEPYDVVLAMSILHLLTDRDAVLAKVRRLIKPGGMFFSSTACIAEMGSALKYVLPVGRALRLLPNVRVFTEDQLAAQIAAAGFEITDRWTPRKGAAVFIAARAV